MMTKFSNTQIAKSNSDDLNKSMIAFAANELIPLMAAFWPKSSASMIANVSGNSVAYGMMLSGFTPSQIRLAVKFIYENEPNRDFPPEPMDLKKACINATVEKPERDKQVFTASIAAIEMQIFVAVVSGKIKMSDIDRAIEWKKSKIIAAGGVVMDGSGFEPLRKLIVKQGF